MILTDDLYQKSKTLKEKLAKAGQSVDLQKLEQEQETLSKTMHSPDFWNDQANAQAISQNYKRISQKLSTYKKLDAKLQDVDGLIEMCEGEEDMLAETQAELNSLDVEVEKFYLAALLTGKYDDCDAIVTLHAGAGGTEAQDWVEMLYRMYSRYCERSGYKTEELDRLDGDEAGIKSVTFEAQGENAYGYLKAEKGVHRLVRISPFDANKRRQTSFASVEVMPRLELNNDIIIEDKDLKVDTFRSSGAGGQHINKTESAIRITHVPSGIVVSCQTQRSQIQNREQAMMMLKAKLAEIREREQLAQANEIKGEIKKIEWGSQIRSYVFCPYTLVKDHRTGFENANVSDVMDGDIQPFIEDYLTKSK